MPRRLATYLLACLVVAASSYTTGCSPALPGQDPSDAREFKSRTLTPGITTVRLPAGYFQSFEVEASANQDIEIIAVPTESAILGIGFAESPDGREFSAYPGARRRSRDGRFRVDQWPADETGTGFRFVGTATEAGTWYFSILAQPRFDVLKSWDALKRRGGLEYLILFSYLLNGQPALTGPPAKLLYWALPELMLLREPLEIVVSVQTAQAGEFVDPAEISDNDSGNGSDGSGGNGGGGAGGDENNTDDGGGSSDQGGQDDGDAGDGNGSDTGNGTDDGTDGTSPVKAVSIETIVKTGDAVPGESGVTFTYFGNPVIDEAGRVAFYAAYTGDSRAGGLFVWQDGMLESVYKADSTLTGVATGMDPNDYLGGFRVRWNSGSPHLAWGSNGRLLLAAHLSGFSQPNALLRWRATDGDLLLVSDAERLRAIISDSTADFLPEFYHPGLTDDGVAIFSNRYSYFRQNGAFALFVQGIFTTDATTTDELGVGWVPEQPDFAQFGDKRALLTSHNASGDILFQSTYTSSEGDGGVYLLRDGEVVRVVDNAVDRSFPGLAAGAQVGASGEDFDAIAIGSQGDIAIDTTLTVSDETRDTVLLWNGTRWRELRSLSNDYASDLLSGVNDDAQVVYLAGERPYLSDGQKVVDLARALPAELFGVDVEWEPFGGALNDHGHAVLRYRRTAVEGSSGMLLWGGDRLLLVIDNTQPVGLSAIDAIFSTQQRGSDEMDRVGTVSDRPEVNRPGLSGVINDHDELVFRAGYRGADGLENTTDDRQAIFLAYGE